jgi:hypothetical protein
MIQQPFDFWSIPQADVLAGLDTRQEGCGSDFSFTLFP